MNMRVLFILSIFLVFDNINQICCDRYDELLNHTFHNYNKHARPNAMGAAVNVNMTFEVIDVFELNEKTQTLTLNTVFHFNWIDQRLA